MLRIVSNMTNILILAFVVLLLCANRATTIAKRSHNANGDSKASTAALVYLSGAILVAFTLVGATEVLV